MGNSLHMHTERQNQALCIFECILTVVMMLMMLNGHKFVYLYGSSNFGTHFPYMQYSSTNYRTLTSVRRLFKVTTADRRSSNDSSVKDPCMTVSCIFAIRLYRAARNP